MPLGNYGASSIQSAPQSAPKLSDDEADNLYFECRDMNYSHAQAITHVEVNGASPSWVKPIASDYQGLPDVQRTPNPNAGRGGFDRMVAAHQPDQAESSATGALQDNLNTPLPSGVCRMVRANGRFISYEAASSNYKNKESFSVGKKRTESEARAAAIAARQEMDAGTWVPKSQR